MSSTQIIRARAPLRISFGGGGTDVPPFVTSRGGCVLNATLARYAHVTLIPGGETVRLRSLDLDEDVAYTLDESPPAQGMDLARGVVEAMRARLPGGFTLFTHTDCPPGSGLGASSTMVVALVGAFDRWLRLGLGPYDIAALAHRIEREDLGIKGGRQDQYAAVFGGFNFTEFGPDDTLVNPLRMPESWIAELEYALVLAYTGRSRLSASIIAEQMANVEAGHEDPILAMERQRELAHHMKRLLLRGDFRAFGQALDEAWQVKKRMAGSITTPQIDALYQAATNAGALGGKIAGAGGGGFMFFFTDFDRRHAVEHALAQQGAEVVPFTFTDRGVHTWIR